MQRKNLLLGVWTSLLLLVVSISPLWLSSDSKNISLLRFHVYCLPSFIALPSTLNSTCTPLNKKTRRQEEEEEEADTKTRPQKKHKKKRQRQKERGTVRKP